MKFFLLKHKQNKIKIIDTNILLGSSFGCEDLNLPIRNFNLFLIKDGFLIKNKLILSNIFKNLNYFLYYNQHYIYNNYPEQKWIVEDMISKKLNYIYIFNIVTNLIKPPFVIKSMLIPKKLRKKTKQKYLIKIVYKNENKRLKNSYKQLTHYSNKFIDSKFKTRLYKSLLFSFLDWKNSYLFKLKTMVFKKFFKF